MAGLDEAAGAETKSSAGDKYETAREMLAQARRLVEARLAEIIAFRDILDGMAAACPGDRIGFGSLADTSQGCYLVGAGLGELEIGGYQVRVISLASPLGAALKGCRAGETVSFRGTTLEVLRLIS